MPVKLSLPLLRAKNQLSSEQAILYLFDVKLLDDPLTEFHAVSNNEDVVFGGQIYQAYPIELRSLSQDTEGNIGESEIVIANVTRDVTFYLEQGGVVGNAVTVRVVHEAHLDAGDHLLMVKFQIKSAEVRDTIASFRVGLPDLLEMSAPSQRLEENRCRHVYKGAMCGYTGPLETCSKQLEGTEGCRAHANESRFGAFPGLLREGI